MNREEMITRINAGEKTIDLAIVKWEDIVAGTGKDEGCGNCAMCYISERQDKYHCKKCPFYLYGNKCRYYSDYENAEYKKDIGNQRKYAKLMLESLIECKERMIELGVYDES